MTDIMYTFFDQKDSRDIIEPYIGYDLLLRYLSDQKRVSIRTFQDSIASKLKRNSLEEDDSHSIFLKKFGGPQMISFQSAVHKLEKGSFNKKIKNIRFKEPNHHILPFAPNHIRIGIVDFFKLGIPKDVAIISVKTADYSGGDLWINEDFAMDFIHKYEDYLIGEIQFLLASIPSEILDLIRQHAQYNLLLNPNQNLRGDATHLAHKQEFYAKDKPAIFTFKGENFEDNKFKTSAIIRSATRINDKM